MSDGGPGRVYGDEFAVDVFCIGVPRSRSTWLKEIMKGHCQIYVPEIKEPNYFVRTYNLYRDEDNPTYLCGWDWYRGLYSRALPGQVRVDFSVNMLFYKHDSARLVAKYFPRARFIVVLRNPIDRTYSHYWYDFAGDLRSIVPRTFEEALFNSRLVECSRYFEQVRIWLDYFDIAKFYFMFDFDLDADTDLAMEGLSLFLDVENIFCKVSKDKVNGCYMYRPFYPPVLRMASFGRRNGFKKIVDVIGKSRIGGMVDKYGKRPFQYPAMGQDTRERLKEWLMPDIENLEKLLGRDLGPWKM